MVRDVRRARLVLRRSELDVRTGRTVGLDSPLHRFLQHPDSRHRLNRDAREARTADCRETRHRLPRRHVLLPRLGNGAVVRLRPWHQLHSHLRDFVRPRNDHHARIRKSSTDATHQSDSHRSWPRQAMASCNFDFHHPCRVDDFRLLRLLTDRSRLCGRDRLELVLAGDHRLVRCDGWPRLGVLSLLAPEI